MNSGCRNAKEPGVSRVVPDRESGDRRGRSTFSAEFPCLQGHELMAARADVGPKQWFCFFHSDAGPMAVTLHSVAEVVETDTLVRLAWSPPQVIGLCSYHRDVVPVVRLNPQSRETGEPVSGGGDPARGRDPAGERSRAMSPGGCVVLILKTEQGAWGIPIDSEHTVMSEESPESHTPRMSASGPVLIGVVRLGGTGYEILDAEETWRGLRSVVSRWSGLIHESYPSSSMLSGDQPIAASPGGSGFIVKT